MISNRCARKSLVTNCNSIISKNYLRLLVDSNDNRYLNSLNREEVITTLTDFLSVLDEIQSFSGELIGLYSELLDEKMSSLQNGINVFKEEHKPELSQE